ncbi:tyrosine-type recombinase/integrase [Aestuariirhabdus litorea]|uniref:tyrosine-type recombinase/integrase n=1 Tax=Aestuariirhabdus litorea TaxID=2528527 RepID=UPI001FB32C70|nr:tyrosine-type recombinase/integrase [Aestuariirhabdus litorea]
MATIGTPHKDGNVHIDPLICRSHLLLEELKVRACGSSYFFPRRRTSKRYPHMSPDTLNAALNKLAEANVIQHFTVHDLRCSFRSLLARIGTPPHIAESWLNHKLKGVEGIYDRYDYLQERRKALSEVAKVVSPFINIDT